MANRSVNKVVVVEHAQGLHARPAELVAKAAMQFASRVEIIRDEMRIDAKSILNILTLGAEQGVELTIEAEGDDAVEAVESIAKLIEGELAEADATTIGDEST